VANAQVYKSIGEKRNKIARWLTIRVKEKMRIRNIYRNIQQQNNEECSVKNPKYTTFFSKSLPGEFVTPGHRVGVVPIAKVIPVGLWWGKEGMKHMVGV